MAGRRDRERREERRASAEGWAKEQDRGFEPTAVKLPEGVTFFKLDKVGTYEVDIVEYRVGEGNPRADEGFLHFEREYHAHRVPMPNGRKQLYCCLWETFGKKCPICEWMNANGNTADQQLLKDLRPQKRHLWNVIDRNSKERKIQVWDTNHFNRGLGFGEQIADAIINVPKYRTFAQTDGGFTLHLTAKEQTFPGGKFNAVTRIDFMPREDDLPEDTVDKCVCLDSCLVELSYDELKRIFLQEPAGGKKEEKESKPVTKSEVRTPISPASKNGDDDDDEDDRPIGRGGRAPSANKPTASVKSHSDDDEDDEPKKEPKVKTGDRVRYKKKDWDVIKVSGDGTSLTLEDDDGETMVAISPEYVTVLDDEDDDSPKPKSAATTGGGKKETRKAPDDSDDDDDDEDNEPKKPAKATSRVTDPDDDDDDDDDNDDEPAPPKKRGRPAKS